MIYTIFGILCPMGFTSFIWRLGCFGSSPFNPPSGVSSFSNMFFGRQCFYFNIIAILCRDQVKKRKTGESSSILKAAETIGMSASIPKAEDEPADTYAEAPHNFPDIQDEPPSMQKETTEHPNPPSSQKATEDMMPDPDPVFIIGTSYSKPTSAVLTKHVPKDVPILVEKGMTK